MNDKNISYSLPSFRNSNFDKRVIILKLCLFAFMHAVFCIFYKKVYIISFEGAYSTRNNTAVVCFVYAGL